MTLLYKYRPFSNGEEQNRLYDILQTHRFWFAKASDVNDPFEFMCAVDFSWSIDDTAKAFTIIEMHQNPHLNPEVALTKVKQVLSKVSTEKLKLRQRELSEAVWRRLSQSVTMCCFAGTPLSVLMWSHYAGGHSGVCIEVDVSSISDFVYPITYSDSLPSISPLALVHAEVGTAHSLFENLFLRKATWWSYELKSRIMRAKGSMKTDIKSYYQQLEHGAIKRVIVGMAMPSENRERLCSYIKKNASNIEIGYVVPSGEDRYASKIVSEREFGI